MAQQFNYETAKSNSQKKVSGSQQIPLDAVELNRHTALENIEQQTMNHIYFQAVFPSPQEEESHFFFPTNTNFNIMFLSIAVITNIVRNTVTM